MNATFQAGRDSEILRSIKTLETINRKPAAEFWKEVEAQQKEKPGARLNDPDFQKWMKDVAALTAEKQVEAVSKKLMEMNPGFDGTLFGYYESQPMKIAYGVVIELGCSTEKVTDLSPFRALVNLEKLYVCAAPGKGNLTDLSPLQGMKLNALACFGNKLDDLSPLKELPLTQLVCEQNSTGYRSGPLYRDA